MSDFDDKMHRLLSEDDKAFISDHFTETGYYKEVLESFRGAGGGLHIAVWGAVLVTSALLLYSVWQFFHVETVRDQIMFAALAVMSNTAQIAFKNWANQRINRRAIMIEIQRLRMDIARSGHGGS